MRNKIKFLQIFSITFWPGEKEIMHFCEVFTVITVMRFSMEAKMSSESKCCINYLIWRLFSAQSKKQMQRPLLFKVIQRRLLYFVLLCVCLVFFLPQQHVNHRLIKCLNSYYTMLPIPCYQLFTENQSKIHCFSLIHTFIQCPTESAKYQLLPSYSSPQILEHLCQEVCSYSGSCWSLCFQSGNKIQQEGQRKILKWQLLFSYKKQRK